jgi:putative secretion ATPase (PEP-CTERM system associated)
MYDSYFGFREPPFSVTPDPRFFYTNSLYQEAFAALLYGIKAKKGFIVVTGEVGTGKTTLLRKLIRNLEATVHSVFIFNTHLNFHELLQLILQDLGLASKGESRLMMIQELNEYLIQQLKKDHTVSLLIDEAQNLSDEALEGLRLLSNLETDKKKLLQIVLMGQPELDAKLNKPSLRQLRQRIALRCHLESLTQKEVGNYIRYRLQEGGYDGPDIFSRQAVDGIWGYSLGIPRLINIICDNALLIAYAKSKKMVSADMIREVARDLRLGLENQTSERPVPIANMLPANGKDELPRALKEEPLKGKSSLLARVRVGGLLALFFLVSLALVTDPKQAKYYIRTLGLDIQVEKLLRVVGESRKFFEDWFNLREAPPEKVHGSLAPEPSAQSVSDPQGRATSNPNLKHPTLDEQAAPSPSRQIDKRADAENQKASRMIEFNPSDNTRQRVAGDWKNEPMVIPYGSTIFGIARDIYGPGRMLAMDLLKEFNTHIENLNWVLAGQNLWLPPLSRETLVRKQPDGSYRLVLGSFQYLLGAERFAQILRQKGYEVAVTPRRVANTVLLHRVEIVGLENSQALNQAWETTVESHLISLPYNPSAEQPKEQNLRGR